MIEIRVKNKNFSSPRRARERGKVVPIITKFKNGFPPTRE